MFMLKRVSVFLGLLWFSVTACAEEIRVGCVTNFIAAAEEIARSFEKATEHHVKFTPGSSGKLVIQAKEQKDLDILLLAEIKISKELDTSDFLVKNSRFTYALGKLVLWSKDPKLVDNKGEVLRHGNFKQILFPDVENTSYGIAAKQIMQNMGLWQSLEPKIVFAPHVLAVWDQLSEGKVELGFTALSLFDPSKKLEGSLWIVPQRLYPLIEQQAVLLKTAANNSAALAFMNFLKTAQVQNIIEKHSFGLPSNQY